MAQTEVLAVYEWPHVEVVVGCEDGVPYWDVKVSACLFQKRCADPMDAADLVHGFYSQAAALDVIETISVPLERSAA